MSEDDKYNVIKKAREKMKQLEDKLNKRPLYYDRKGRPIDLEEYAQLFGDMNYRIVAHTDIVATAKHPASYLSTVWLGIDHSFLYTGPPLIFETMRFTQEFTKRDRFLHRPYREALEFPYPYDEHQYTEQARYLTEEQASLGHQAIVKLIHELELT